VRLKNRFSASAGRESQGGGLLQLALARLSPAEQVLPDIKPLVNRIEDAKTERLLMEIDRAKE
jgi:hypothetical protein